MKIQKLILIPALLVGSLLPQVGNAQDRFLSKQEKMTVNDEHINEIIGQMTLEEKVEMLHSKTIMSSEGVPRLGIDDIKYADGPFGIREEVGDMFRPLGWELDSATYFPTGSALAATWSPKLAYKYGTGMAREAERRGIDMILGPAMNIQRVPVCGRTYEYFSEDPILAGALAVGYVEGVQDVGRAVCLKHYAVNNQEADRGTVNAVVDERSLHELYLRPFEAAVIDGGAWGVMTAYNKVNGYWCSENDYLNNVVLRGMWGFNGMTVSDWGGTHSTMGAALGGLNVQMTGDTYLGPALIDSIKAGKIDEKVVDDKVREILRVRFMVDKVPENVANTVMASQPREQQIAYDVAAKSIVLMKNEGNILPLKTDEIKTIAVIGQNAVLSTAAGGMGAGIKTLYEVTPLDGLKAQLGDKVEIIYAPAYKNFMWAFGPMEPDPLRAENANDPVDPKLLKEAVAAAKKADVVLFFAGTNKYIESEGMDRKSINLPVGQNEIAKALAKANPNMVTIHVSGAPTDLRQVEPISKAMVQAWWNGLEGGNALADVLLGNISPSGKMPFTWPMQLGDVPAYALGVYPQSTEAGKDIFGTQYREENNDDDGKPDFSGYMNPPKEGPEALYSEGLYVGYRWYEKKNVEVMCPFGFGLSYVDFGYSNLTTDKASYQAKDVIRVSFELENKGTMEADEVPQVYVSRKNSKLDWPLKELKAFDRVTLKAGEKRTVSLEIPVEDLYYWDVDKDEWAYDPCNLQILVGSSSEQMLLKKAVSCKL